MSNSAIAQEVEKRLIEKLSPEELKVFDDSGDHVGHPGVAATGGAHIRIEIKSSKLLEESRLNRHRKVNECLDDLLKSNQIHALVLKVL